MGFFKKGVKRFLRGRRRVKWPYILIWSSLITHIASHRVTESSESEEDDLLQNTTTLYPVVNATAATKNEANESKDTAKIKSDAATWKLETAYAESKLPESFKDNGTDLKESKELKKESDKSVNSSKEFRPSQQIDTFLDDSAEALPTRATLGSFRPIRKPAAGFLSSHRDPFKLSLYNAPREIFRQNDFPYKIEDTIFTRAKSTWQPATLDSKPTLEVPIKVPAGGLYKSPEAFKDKPGLTGDEEDFGLDFNGDVKENSVDVKKRVNPWKNLLRLVTAFIPVGLIISALTPNVITIENTGNLPDNRYPQPLFRRADSAELPAISEPCRRRLLCELHSQTNYMQGTASPQRRGKRCYKLRCEEPEALSRALRWLLTYHRGDNAEDTDHRGRHYT